MVLVLKICFSFAASSKMLGVEGCCRFDGGFEKRGKSEVRDRNPHDPCSQAELKCFARPMH